MLSIVLMFLKNYWKQAAIVLGALLLFGLVRHHYIQMGEARSEARHLLLEQEAAQKLEKAKEAHNKDNQEAQAKILALGKERDQALDAARKTPAVLTKIVTKVMHEGETCTDHDIGPDFERVWNAAAEAGGDKPMP